MSKSLRILIGILTLWITLSPLLFVILWFGTFIPMVLLSESQGSGDTSPILFLAPFVTFMVGLMITSFVQIGLQIFYLIHIIRNARATEILRILVGVGLFFVPFIAMPVYFLTFVWPAKPPQWALAEPAAEVLA